MKIDRVWKRPVSQVLTHVQIQLLSVCNSERQAVILGEIITDLPEHATYEQIEAAVIAALAAVLEAKNGKTQVEYCGGQNFYYRRVQ